ncbi:uncharacterized protein [Dermacentor albipictus]|uniref:uncharacterized protein n=1 Tax=Dermacentor albipictus TaxID=60249 RepID=UPI0038FCB8A9
MTMGEEAQRLFMTMIKESPLPAASAVIDALATPENVGEIPDENTAASDVGERGPQPAPEVKRGGGAPKRTPGETKLLLDCYYKYFPQVGPFMTHKSKSSSCDSSADLLSPVPEMSSAPSSNSESGESMKGSTESEYLKGKREKKRRRGVLSGKLSAFKNARNVARCTEINFSSSVRP